MQSETKLEQDVAKLGHLGALIGEIKTSLAARETTTATLYPCTRCSCGTLLAGEVRVSDKFFRAGQTVKITVEAETSEVTR